MQDAMQNTIQNTQRKPLSLTTVLICGGLLVTLSMGIRHGFGLFNLPITQTHGWSRETFAFALALQNLMWGVTQPFTGALADKFGGFRIMLVGIALYVAGLVVMAMATSGTAFASGAGILIGIAQSGTTYSVVYGVIGRVASPEKRVWAMGIAADHAVHHAIGSAGLRNADQDAGARGKGGARGGHGHHDQARHVQRNADEHDAEPAKLVGQCARKRLGHAPHQVLQRQREGEGLAAPAVRLRDREVEQAEAVPDTHR